MNITIYYRDEDDNFQKLVVAESEALNKVRELLDEECNVVTGISLPHP